MKIENGKVVLEKKDCPSCEKGLVNAPTPCPECNGTGQGKRGGVGKCKKCYGLGRVYGTGAKATCTRCNGNYVKSEPETVCDYLPADALRSIPIQVVRQDRTQTFNEAYVGIGCLYTVTDYGRAWTSVNTDYLIKEVWASMTQATKICDRDQNVCTKIVILVHPTGYSIRPLFS